VNQKHKARQFSKTLYVITEIQNKKINMY